MPAGLIDAWEGEGEVVLVDAVSSGAPPGTVHRLPDRLELYGSEGRAFGAGAALAPEVRRAVEEVAAELAWRLQD